MSVTSTAQNAVKTAMQPSSGKTADEKAMLAGLTGDDLKRAEAQLAMQKRSETVAFVSNIMKMLNQIAMSTINNLRG